MSLNDPNPMGLNGILEPGMIVQNPAAPDWGLGQVQSRVGDRITVNFEHAGKKVIDGRRVALILVIADQS
ncbi:DUF3553 domain-containing protein [Phaeovulum sp.]|uniref:DUF3553 domain-containing protein n=1 Tax=Phaeovulum sp. TaxID=2934796 RepID=UPI0039E3C6E4